MTFDFGKNLELIKKRVSDYSVTTTLPVQADLSIEMKIRRLTKKGMRKDRVIFSFGNRLVDRIE
jgi:hypothetical protein